MNFCSSCGVKQNEESNFCPSCGESLLGIMKPIESISVEPLEREAKPTDFEKIGTAWKEFEGKGAKARAREWYQTGWVWFWLILVWPVGLYGLIKRG